MSEMEIIREFDDLCNIHEQIAALGNSYLMPIDKIEAWLKPAVKREICKILMEIEKTCGNDILRFKIMIADRIAKYSPAQYCEGMQEAIKDKSVHIMPSGTAMYYKNDEIGYIEYEYCLFCKKGKNCLKEVKNDKK